MKHDFSGDDGATEERIRNIHKDVWIECPQAGRIINSIIALSQVPKRTTAPCMLVYGDGGSGKTAIVNQFKKMNRGLGSPFAFLSLAENPNNLNYKQLILESLGVPMRLAEKRGMLSQEVAGFIQSREIRVLVIDEFHDLLLVPRNEQLKNLSLQKGLSGDPFNLSVIGFGTRAAKNALSSDVQLNRRYHTVELKPWGINHDFRNFLATLEKKVSLKNDSLLYQEDMVRLIHYHSKGLMDNVLRIVKSAAIYAVITGEERITKELIEKAVLDPWGYKSMK
ncbi:TniB family NTP-binding protein [Pseudomonas rubra]|uniref:TniB family NTP-binding protein n=1 Tax=Pseudomonas rubra TaxID=2942627 RepID=A0ABT5PC63_9PSED|nr:TniB family NTP-binding protein [Pseudomonas rubra]MDD1015901.1 TniB family NTP-binding protein [Pseudomonas rubra]MDD1040195.1 TniB family NTP-binding protein [Pseudomonas rubra]MDD1157929.1 TniB family NTP-binding protein [Pseudomonas rubra]